MAVTVVLPSSGAGPEDIAPLSSVEDSPVAAPITVAGMCHRRKHQLLNSSQAVGRFLSLGLFVATKDSNATGRATISNIYYNRRNLLENKHSGGGSSAIRALVLVTE
jgi:hypothetical protein